MIVINSNVSGSLVPASYPDDRLRTYFDGSTNCVFTRLSELSGANVAETKIPSPKTILKSTQTTFPLAFFGLNTGRGDTSLQDSVPNYKFGLVRSHDDSAGGWSSVERKATSVVRVGNLVTVTLYQPPSSEFVSTGDKVTIRNIIEAGFNGEFVVTRISISQFSYVSSVSANTTATTASTIIVQNWLRLDDWVSTHFNQNRKLLYTVYQTPTWASARSTDKGPYTFNGTNAEPANMLDLSSFITDVVTRYNSKGTPIDYWEVSNEVNWVGGYDAASSTPLRFYSGTVAKLSEMVRTVSQAVKAVTPVAKIISPSMTNLTGTTATLDGGGHNTLAADVAATYFSAMMSASDGASGTMAQWVDIIGYHSYAKTCDAMIIDINIIKSMALAASLSALPLINTECGCNGLNSLSSDLDLFRYLSRIFVVNKLLAIDAVCVYAIGNEKSYTLSLKGFPKVMVLINKFINDLYLYGIETATLSSEEVAFKMNGVQYII